jgi:hypothetical protein
MKKTAMVVGLALAAYLSLFISCAGKATPVAVNPAKLSVAEPAPAPVKPEQASPANDTDELMRQGVDGIVSGKYPEALNAFQEILKLAKPDDSIIPVTYYNIACTYALISAKDGSPAGSKDATLALEYLGKAIKAGYDNRESIEADPDLVSLHNLPEYKAVLDTIPPITAITPTEEDEAAQKEALKLIEEIRGVKYKSEPKYKLMAPDQFERAYGGGRSSDSILGFYRWSDKTLYIKQGLDPARFKGTRIHETFHALQDQLFATSETQKTVKTTDGHFALTALIEGDATLTFIECMPESMARMMIRSATPWRMMGGEAVYDKSPNGEAAKRQGAFGYSTAARFIKAIKEAKGWAGVNAMYTNIPKSTEQVLHPEKYLAGELPVEVTIADVAGVLGEGWDTSKPETVGEFGILLTLLTNDKSGPLAEEAASGWGGDKLVLIGNKGTKQAFSIHKTVWDTAKDAREFFDAAVLSMEENGKLQKTDNTATTTDDKGNIDYLMVNGTTVMMVSNLPPELKDKVLK